MNPKPSKASLTAMDHLLRSVWASLVPNAHLHRISCQSWNSDPLMIFSTTNTLSRSVAAVSETVALIKAT